MQNTSAYTIEHLALDVDAYFDAVYRNDGHDAVWHLSSIGERMVDLMYGPNDGRHKPYVENDVVSRIGAEIFGEYNGAHYTVRDDLDVLAELPIRVSLGCLPLLAEFRLPVEDAAEQLEAILPSVRKGVALIQSGYSVDSHIESMAKIKERVSVAESRRTIARIPFFDRLVPTEKVLTYEAKVAQLLCT